MTRSEIFRDCLSELEAAATLVRGAMSEAAELRAAARHVEKALDEAQNQATNATLNPDGSHGRRYIAGAAEQCEIVRQRSALASNLAARIEERLDAASVHVSLAREKQEHAAGHEDSSRIPAMEHAYLHAAITYLSHQIELALPLARSARINLEQAATSAAGLLKPDQGEALRRITIFQVDRGIQSTARAFERADEASQHLERAIELTTATAVSTRMRAEHIAEHLRPPPQSLQPPSGLPARASSGPSR